MTKPATIRWKFRSSKNLWSARYLNAPPVLGARLASSVIWKSPHVVETVATYVFAGSRRSVGFLSFAMSFGIGGWPLPQPLDTGSGLEAAGVLVLSAGFPPPPQPAASRARQASRRATGRTTPGKDNGTRLAPDPRRPRLRPRAAGPGRLRVARRRGASGGGGRGGGAARGGQVDRVPHQRRAPLARGVRAQAVAARLPGVAGRGGERRRGAAVPPRRAQRARDGVRGRLAGAGRPRGRRGAAHRQPHEPRRPRGRRGGRRPRRARVRGAQAGHPGRAARRRADRRDTRRQLPDAGRAVA